MTPQRARAILGVGANASFEDILASKNTKLGLVGSDPEKAMELEAAYDLLFMQARGRAILAAPATRTCPTRHKRLSPSRTRARCSLAHALMHALMHARCRRA